MALLSWKSSYNTGIDEVDTQHKQLLDYLNQLDQARKFKNKREVQDVIEGVGDYTISHFAFEEALMQEAQYAYAGPHKHVHDTLIKRVVSFQQRFEQGEDITTEFYNLLRRWLINHIQRDDAAYVKAVKLHLDSQKTPEPQQAEETRQQSWMARAVKKFFG